MSQQAEQRLYRVTGLYRQEIHADITAASAEEAAIEAMRRFDQWVETGEEGPGISLGPEEPEIDEEVLISLAKDPTPEDPTYWADQEDLYVTRNVEGEYRASTEGGSYG